LPNVYVSTVLNIRETIINTIVCTLKVLTII
jgi:hypothetical protein